MAQNPAENVPVEKRDKNDVKKQWGWVGAFLATLVILNPGEQRHRRAMQSHVDEYVASGTLTSAAEYVTGGGFSDSIREAQRTMPLQYNNYLLFSTAGMQGVTITTGFCGMVWVRSK